MTPITPETSFFTFFFPASHFFTDRVKLCSTNCLSIIFSAVGWVRAEGGGVTPESTGEKKNLKCIWHSDELHLPHHPVGSKASPMSTGAQIVVQKSLRLSPSNLTFCLRECFPHEVIIMSQHETIYFKKSDTEGNLRLCTLPIWNLNLFDMGFHHGLIFSCSFIFFFLSPHRSFARGQEGACSAARIASEGAWEASKPIESGATCQKRWPDYFLNATFLWISHSGDSPCDDCW